MKIGYIASINIIMTKKIISIGIICFNEGLNIAPAYNELVQVSNRNKKYNYEFIFVDNGSTDNTQSGIRQIAKIDKRVIGVFLSRNFGPEASAQASLECSSGDAFVCFEGDMQDPPEVILDFIKKWEQGFNVVVGVRNKMDDGVLKRLFRRIYYRIFRTISNIEVPINAGSFGLLDKKAMLAINNMPEKYRSFRGLRAWVGFKTAFVNYNRGKRKRGKSSYNFFKYFHDAERSFLGFSYLPLDIILFLSLILIFISCICAALYLFSIIFGQSQNSFLLILSLSLFFGGIQLLALSIIGKYIQVIVEETKKRPTYIIDEIVNKK